MKNISRFDEIKIANLLYETGEFSEQTCENSLLRVSGKCPKGDNPQKIDCLKCIKYWLNDNKR